MPLTVHRSKSIAHRIPRRSWPKQEGNSRVRNQARAVRVLTISFVAALAVALVVVLVARVNPIISACVAIALIVVYWVIRLLMPRYTKRSQLSK